MNKLLAILIILDTLILVGFVLAIVFIEYDERRSEEIAFPLWFEESQNEKKQSVKSKKTAEAKVGRPPKTKKAVSRKTKG